MSFMYTKIVCSQIKTVTTPPKSKVFKSRGKWISLRIMRSKCRSLPPTWLPVQKLANYMQKMYKGNLRTVKSEKYCPLVYYFLFWPKTSQYEYVNVILQRLAAEENLNCNYFNDFRLVNSSEKVSLLFWVDFIDKWFNYNAVKFDCDFMKKSGIIQRNLNDFVSRMYNFKLSSGGICNNAILSGHFSQFLRLNTRFCIFGATNCTNLKWAKIISLCTCKLLTTQQIICAFKKNVVLLFVFACRHQTSCKTPGNYKHG